MSIKDKAPAFLGFSWRFLPRSSSRPVSQAPKLPGRLAARPTGRVAVTPDCEPAGPWAAPLPAPRAVYPGAQLGRAPPPAAVISHRFLPRRPAPHSSGLSNNFPSEGGWAAARRAARAGPLEGRGRGASRGLRRGCGLGLGFGRPGGVGAQRGAGRAARPPAVAGWPQEQVGAWASPWPWPPSLAPCTRGARSFLRFFTPVLKIF